MTAEELISLLSTPFKKGNQIYACVWYACSARGNYGGYHYFIGFYTQEELSQQNIKSGSTMHIPDVTGWIRKALRDPWEGISDTFQGVAARYLLDNLPIEEISNLILIDPVYAGSTLVRARLLLGC